MNLDKRDFSNFADFPGQIDKTDKSYKFPSLFHVDANKHTRIWTSIIRLVKGRPKKYLIDWDLMQDNTIPVCAAYLNNKPIPNGTIAQLYVETGVIGGKITRHAPTYPKVMNAGRSNERNVFEQALVMGRSAYLKKIDNGCVTETDLKKTPLSQDKMYFPMLVRKYQDEGHRLTYPLYVQPKLDGSRCVAFLNKAPRNHPTFHDIIMYTRQKKTYTGFDQMRQALLPALIDMWDFSNNESLYVDGELYKHGMSLQTISGAVRNPNRKNITKYKDIQYHVFDVFYPSRLNMPFVDRLSYTNDFFDTMPASRCIVKVPTVRAKTKKAQDGMYKKLLSKKFEGVILRNRDSPYLAHQTKNSAAIRSKVVLKRKMTYSDEFQVVNFTQGTRGKDKGAIIWICQTHDGSKQFNTTPKNTTYIERYTDYKDALLNFSSKYDGRMMTVEYEDLSKDKVPLRAKAAGFRSHL
jgi:hypothetical protein